MRMPIMIAALITEQEIRSIMPVEAKAVLFLSDNECTEICLWDIMHWFNSNNPKLMIDLHHREDPQLGSSYILAGLDWEDVPEDMTKADVITKITSEIKRLVNIDTDPKIMQIPECYCFYEYKKEE